MAAALVAAAMVQRHRLRLKHFETTTALANVGAGMVTEPNRSWKPVQTSFNPPAPTARWQRQHTLHGGGRSPSVRLASAPERTGSRTS